MEFMDHFDEVIIARGYDYFTQDQVLDIEQNDTFEYRGHVAGSCKEPYEVRINVLDPRESECNCPYAKDGHMCKHMAALWMAAFPDLAEDYDYCDDYSDDWYGDREDDDYYDGYEYEATPVGSLKKSLEDGLGTMYYDELLDDYLDGLSPEELRSTLRAELILNKERTFNRYLKARYKEFIGRRGDVSELLDALNSRLILLERKDDYDWKDYSQPILSEDEKKKNK